MIISNMAAAGNIFLVLTLSLVVGLSHCGDIAIVPAGGPQYCSFFNNRAPSTQPNLKNCTWFKENSCCQQQEIKATFERVKPLKGASEACQRYMNYLMCYVCAPNQNIFYKKERLTVCEEFCDRLYGACGTAILKGTVIKDLYRSGRHFCKSRRFTVREQGCFSFDPTLDKTSGAAGVSSSLPLYVIVVLATLCTVAPLPSSNLTPRAVDVCLTAQENLSAAEGPRGGASGQPLCCEEDSAYREKDSARRRRPQTASRYRPRPGTLSGGGGRPRCCEEAEQRQRDSARRRRPQTASSYMAAERRGGRKWFQLSDSLYGVLFTLLVISVIPDVVDTLGAVDERRWEDSVRNAGEEELIAADNTQLIRGHS